MNRKKRPLKRAEPEQGPELMPLNLVVGHVEIQPVTTITVQPRAIGVPIMREGFITDTGFLITASSAPLVNLVP